MTVPSLPEQVEAADSTLYLVPGRFTSRDVRLLRDVAALLLLLAGLVGLGWVTWQIGPLLTATYCSLLAIATGVALGYDRRA